jgi:hypothetical protein
MVFNTLYNFEAWSSGKEPKNHLSEENNFAPFCRQGGVGWMGGELEYRNGEWFSKGVKIPNETINTTICKNCYKKALKMVSE